jgi:DNA transposition AAA+ family ATPase
MTTESIDTAASEPIFHHGQSRIPGDTVNKASADLPDNQRSAIRRFHAYYAEHNLSLAEAANLIRISDSSLSLLFRGKYPAKPDGIVSEIESFFELAEKRTAGRKMEFIPTRLTRRIWSVCETALEFQRIAFIFSESQIGKTEALEAYARAHNHGSTIYIAVPTGGSIAHFTAKLAEKLRIGYRGNSADLRRRIIEAFDDRMLLIVDEAHRCISQTFRVESKIQTIDFIREIFDERKCGVVICATKAFQEAMERGALEKILKQTKRRRLCALNLPDVPTREDLNSFAAAYGLQESKGPARDLENKIVADEALGMWLTILRMASKLAAQRKQKMSWDHVIAAHAGLQDLEGKTRNTI